jgi:hypothetical protein
MNNSTLCFSLSLLALVSGCGGSMHQPARDAGFVVDPAFEINDDDVNKAFAAKPQLPEKIEVAYYSFDKKRSDTLSDTLGAAPNVVSSYQIPGLFVTGKGRFDDDVRNWYSEPKKPVSVKKLRLLAARANSDVLVLFDHGYKWDSSPNGWAATGILLLPVLFVPMADYVVESYLDTYVIDVRNGYLYAHLTSLTKDEIDTELVYSDAATEMLDDQWSRLETETRTKLAKLLANDGLRAETQSSQRAL